RVALAAQEGGLDAAVESFKANPTPNLILVESRQAGDDLTAGLERLAEVCDAATRVIVLGHVNDVLLYRELIRTGVSEYIVLPATPRTVVSAIEELFTGEGAGRVGRSVAFIAAKGGAGSSSLAHN